MDPLTAFVVTTILMLLNGGILGLMHRGLSPALRPAAADWRIGTLLVAGGAVLLSAQSPESLWLVLPVGNAFLLFGLSLYWRSVRRFDGLADTPWLFLPVLCATLALTWFTVAYPIFWIRVIIASVSWSTILLCTALSLFRHRSSRLEVSRVTLEIILLLLTCFMIFRAVIVVVKMRHVNSIMAGDSLLNALTPLSAATLPIIGTTAFLVMCSERLRAELALRAIELDQKNTALMQAIHAREDSERIARHDLKTPLASIAATPGLLRASHAPGPEQEELLCMIENAARRALSMVNLSLDLYQMEQGSFDFQPEPVDLAAITRTVIGDLRAHAQSKHVDIRLAGGDVPVLVAANASLCYSCIANVLKNAVEAASDHSRVELDLQAGERVRLSIHNDTAVPAALRDCFFEKYATKGKVGGTGLGTYSSHVMATVQGGTLSMQTSDTGGTTLSLELNCFRGDPVSNASAVEALELAPALSRHEDGEIIPLHVLVVDDDSYNCKVLCSQLAMYSPQAETALNGRYALAHCLVRRPDLIFMDIEMPVMGGVQAMQHIRDLQQARRQVPSMIVAFSSDDDVDSQARFLALGFDRCMSKPASYDALALLLQSVPVLPPQSQNTSQPVAVLASLLPDIPAFLSSRLQLVDQLLQASAQKDQAQVRRLGHRLGGSLSMYGFAWAADVCRRFESDPENVDLASEAANDLADHLRTVPIIELVEPATAEDA